MANRDLIKLQSNMLTNQIDDFFSDFNDQVSSGKLQDEGNILHKFFAGITELFSNVGKPTMKLRKIPSGSPPLSEDINDTFKEVHNDFRTAFDEQKVLGEGLKLNFNYGVTEKLRLRNKVRNVGEMISDYIAMAKNTIGNRIVIQDTFVTKDLTDLSTVNNPASVNTEEGIVTLKTIGSVRKTEDAAVIGSPILNKKEAMLSNFLIPYQKKDVVQKDSLLKEKPNQFNQGNSSNWDLEFNIDPHADLSVMFDEEPNTWVEWQLVNIPEEYKNKYHPLTKGLGMTYKDGTPIYGGEMGRDYLRVIFTIKLKEPTAINKIVLDPYFPPGSKLKYKVNEISTSLNNASDYQTVFLDNGDYHQTIGGDPADNAADIDKKDRTKYSEKGIWIFPSREAQFIKIDLTCEDYYNCKIAHIFWEREYDVVRDKEFKLLFVPLYSKTDTIHVKERYEGPQIDRSKLKDFFETYELEVLGTAGGVLGAAFLGTALLMGGLVGFLVGALSDYSVTHRVENYKEAEECGLDIFDGWRWCIGIKNLNAYSNKYAQNSTFVSKNLVCHKPISEISLSVSELIPEQFYSENLSVKNDWIKYYLSFDDGKNWYRISPVEHSPIGFSGEEFPNKVIAVNSTQSPDARIPNKTYVSVEGEAKSVKLMAEFTRPEKLEDVTPVLYDYQIRIVPKESEEI